MTEQKKTKKFLKVLGNKYVICTLIFILFFIIIDNNGFMTYYRLRSQNALLIQQKTELEKDILTDSINYQKMTRDLEEIERFGRENYFMKRDNEDIFIVKRDK
ncbi:MAG: septum formation initiator family protein [Bacteroidales bacterium]|nr:septum formation initiator family protein [Bacteroidales bacterium]MBP5240926.1 septum formation initiator family protein [Bacteroidales bacterium]